jgi:hypothetical protein
MFRHCRHRVFWLVCPSLLIHEHGRARIIASISTSPNVAPGAVGHSTSSTPPKRLRRFFLFLRSRTPIGSRVSHQHHSAAYGYNSIYNSIDQRGLLACKLKRMRLIQSNSQPKSHRRPPATPNSLKSLASPPGFEPGTFSLEGAWSRNDFNARSDIFTVRAPFEAIAEFRFVGMPAAPVRAPLDPPAPAIRTLWHFSMRGARSISRYVGCGRIMENRSNSLGLGSM